MGYHYPPLEYSGEFIFRVPTGLHIEVEFIPSCMCDAKVIPRSHAFEEQCIQVEESYGLPPSKVEDGWIRFFSCQPLSGTLLDKALLGHYAHCIWDVITQEVV
jgi:hypothetical protein